MRVMVGATVLISAIVAAVAARPSESRQGGGPPQATKNVQVLPKDWNTQQVAAYMRSNVAPALGVQCNYCHVQDRSSDEVKMKGTARKMMQMMATVNDTLKDIGDPPAAGATKVTCYTCHRGATKPLTAPPSGGGQ